APFGLYDLAYDEGRGLIYGGTDYAVSPKLYAFDLGTKSFDLTKSITIPATVQGQAARALTFNPDGDNGNGSFWIGDGKNSVSEVSRNGALLRTVANVHPNTQAAAYDDEEGIVWWFGVEGSSRKDQGVVGYAMDEATGMVTTLRVLGDNSIPGGSPAGGQVRGAQIWEAAADHENPWLLVLTDADKDWFYEMHARFVVEEGCSGTISFEGDACYSGNTRWTVTLDDSPASFAALVMATAETLDGLALPAPWKKDCKLFPRPDANFVIFPPAAVSNRAAKQPLPIPTDPALIGMSIFMQWFEIETSGVLGMSEEGEAYIHN
ncbi:MAG TPA: hypothetical protein PKE00_12100, partial [Planctomycetota bacterium]|nr:hypothetical protein [Planctomycetota bacterium]